MRTANDILVLSCYELGHQPLAVASAVGFLEQSGFHPRAVDLSVDRLDETESLANLRLVALSVPMHTALRVGVEAARALRRLAPEAHICFYGHYATLNADYLLGEVADSVVGGESEPTLVDLATALENGRALETVDGLWFRGRPAAPVRRRLAFAAPNRRGLPELGRYAQLWIDGETRRAAAVETSRGCLHTCRHCPIPPVYGGRFFVVPRQIVLDDIRRVVEAGARHITFADPDFFNGPGHAMAIVRAMHATFPELTCDVTTKVANVLKHRTRLPGLAASGCLFLVSAVESLSDRVLGHLHKGHTRDDVFEALALLRQAGISMRPSLVAFTPWTTLEDYVEVLDWVEREGLIDQLEPVQLSIRLLVPPGSPLLELEALRPHLTGLEPESFAHGWLHPDPRMDRLHREIDAIVREGARGDEDPRRTFRRIRAATDAARGIASTAVATDLPARIVAPPPRLTEPWFC